MRWPKTYRRDKRQLTLTADNGQSKSVLSLKQALNSTGNLLEITSSGSSTVGDLLKVDTTGKIYFGNDTNIYRSTVGLLYTDSNLFVAGYLSTNGDLYNGGNFTQDGDVTVNSGTIINWNSGSSVYDSSGSLIVSSNCVYIDTMAITTLISNQSVGNSNELTLDFANGIITCGPAGGIVTDTIVAPSGSLTFGFNLSMSNYAISEIYSLTMYDSIGVTQFISGSTNGTQIGVTGNKLGFFGATPIVRPTTGVAAATFTANSGTAINDASTFDGYTIKQAIKALRNLGLLA